MIASAAVAILFDEMLSELSLEEETEKALPLLFDDLFLTYNGVTENDLRRDTLVKVIFAKFSRNLFSQFNVRHQEHFLI